MAEPKPNNVDSKAARGKGASQPKDNLDVTSGKARELSRETAEDEGAVFLNEREIEEALRKEKFRDLVSFGGPQGFVSKLKQEFENRKKKLEREKEKITLQYEDKRKKIEGFYQNSLEEMKEIIRNPIYYLNDLTSEEKGVLEVFEKDEDFQETLDHQGGEPYGIISREELDSIWKLLRKMKLLKEKIRRGKGENTESLYNSLKKLESALQEANRFLRERIIDYYQIPIKEIEQIEREKSEKLEQIEEKINEVERVEQEQIKKGLRYFKAVENIAALADDYYHPEVKEQVEEAIEERVKDLERKTEIFLKMQKTFTSLVEEYAQEKHLSIKDIVQRIQKDPQELRGLRAFLYAKIKERGLNYEDFQPGFWKKKEKNPKYNPIVHYLTLGQKLFSEKMRYPFELAQRREQEGFNEALQKMDFARQVYELYTSASGPGGRWVKRVFGKAPKFKKS